jgi:hypothetical protein
VIQRERERERERGAREREKEKEERAAVGERRNLEETMRVAEIERS